MRHVKMLLAVLMTISISGCIGKECKPNPQRCVVPSVKYPEIDNAQCYSKKCTHDKVLLNYEAMKKYAADLEIANSVCK